MTYTTIILILKIALWSLAAFAAIFIFLACICLIKFYIFGKGKDVLKRSRLALGRVKHSRLKGGATHTFEYPLFFSFVDLHEMESIRSTLWPIFTAYDSSYLSMFSFCSISAKDHMRGWKEGSEDGRSLLPRLFSFVSSKSTIATNHTSNISNGPVTDSHRVMLLTHLSYFAYCFNPISVYYLMKNNTNTINGKKKDSSLDSNQLECIVAEVSNTPWIEQYSYVLHESAKEHGGVEVKRKSEPTEKSFEAKWNKEFHVSPFMEMDYQYNFVFSDPSSASLSNNEKMSDNSKRGKYDGNGVESTLDDRLWVRAKMIKKQTGEVYFTASFVLDTIPFTPLNLLYVLLFYPLHTRIIQVWIHWEALLLWFKSVPMYGHPNNADVQFGFGVTDKTLMKWIINPLLHMTKFFQFSKEKKL